MNANLKLLFLLAFIMFRLWAHAGEPPVVHTPDYLVEDYGSSFVLTNSYWSWRGYFIIEGNEPFTYSLSHDGVLFQKTTQFSLSFTNVTHAQDGSYELVVENAWGSATNTFNFFVQDSLRLISQTSDQVAPLGGPARFDVVAESSGPIAYLWSHNGNSIPGQTNSSLTITNATANDVGNYRCDLLVQNGPAIAYTNTENIFLAVDSPRPIDHWQRLSPKFENANLSGIAAGGGITVIVAENGSIWKSTNRVDWIRANSPVSDALLEVAYGNGRFVAVGSRLPRPFTDYGPPKQSSILVTSSDGNDWQVVKSPTFRPLLSVAFGSGQFVAITTNQIFSSANGLQWTISPAAIHGLVKVRFVNDRFMALGEKQIAVSEDGLSWNVVAVPGDFTSVAGNGNEYLAWNFYRPYYSLPLAWHSSNSVDWVSVPTAGQNIGITDVVFNGGDYVAVGTSFYTCCASEGWWLFPAFATSPDGATWDVKHPNSVGHSSSAGDYFWSMSADEQGVLVVGDSGNVLSISKTNSAIFRGTIGPFNVSVRTTPTFVQSSGSLFIGPITDFGDSIGLTDDLKTWRSIPLPIKSRFFGYGNGVFLTVAGTNYSTSTDGVSWSVSSLPSVTFVSHDIGPGVGFDGKRFIGGFSSSKPPYWYVAISTNAIDWAPIKGPTLFNEMSGANGLAILKYYSQSSNWVSTNGIDWILKSSLNNPTKVIFDGKRYVGIGAVSSEIPSAVFLSDDGVNWIVSTNVPFASARSATIAYHDGTYIAAITYRNYVISASTDVDPKLFSSTDAEHWETVLTGSREAIIDVTFFKGHWIVLGRSGEILESIPISTLKLNPTANNLTVSGEGNTSYELQASEDLNSAIWSPLTTLQTDANGSTSTNLSLPPATNLFLRLKQQSN